MCHGVLLPGSDQQAPPFFMRQQITDLQPLTAVPTASPIEMLNRDAKSATELTPRTDAT